MAALLRDNLRQVAAELEPASPALAVLYRREADRIESGLEAGSGYSEYGLGRLDAKVAALLSVAQVLLEEWRAEGRP